MADDLWKKRQFSTVKVEVDEKEETYASSEIIAEVPERQFDSIDVTIAGKKISFAGSASAMAPEADEGGEIDEETHSINNVEFDDEDEHVLLVDSIDLETHTITL